MLRFFYEKTSFGYESTATKILYLVIDKTMQQDSKNGLKGPLQRQTKPTTWSIKDHKLLVETLARVLENMMKYDQYKLLSQDKKNDIRSTLAEVLATQAALWNRNSAFEALRKTHRYYNESCGLGLLYYPKFSEDENLPTSFSIAFPNQFEKDKVLKEVLEPILKNQNLLSDKYKNKNKEEILHQPPEENIKPEKSILKNDDDKKKGNKKRITFS